MSSDKNHENSDDNVTVTAEMLIAQHKGKALAKAIKQGIKDPQIFSTLIENSTVRRTLSNVLAQNIKNADIIHKLHAAGADIRFDNDALLVYAANEGAEKTVETLISAGAKPNNRALSVAIANGHLNIVKYLIKAGNISLSEKIWKVLLKPLESGKEIDSDLIRLVSPLAKDDQLMDVYKKSREAGCYDTSEIVCESLIYGENRSEKVQHALVKDLCITSGVGKNKQMIGILKDLLHQGIKPNEKELAQIAETGDKTILRLIKRYEK